MLDVARAVCWLIISYAATVTAQEEPILVTGSFEPGKIGIHATWATGRVNKIDKGGQGEAQGVEVGMLMVKVNGEEYSEALLDKAIAGDDTYQVTFKKFPIERKPGDAPPKPNFKYATELTADTFHEKISKVTNWTGKDAHVVPPYYPVVLFHVSWCKHCKHALPEFEKAAQLVDESEKNGQLRHLAAVPKFFLIECDLVPANKFICEAYTGTNYPVCKLFRDHRAVSFNRPRLANTYAWWATHVARRPLSELRDQDVEDVEKQRGPVFVLNSAEKDVDSLSEWTEAALDHIEAYNFVHVKPDSEVAKKMQPAPSVGVLGAGMDPLPFEGELKHENLQQWVSINQFEPVTELDGYSAHALKKSGLVVVVLIYHKENHASLKTKFDFRANQLRKGRQFLFATLDVSNDENGGFLEHAFPLLAPKVAPAPRVFAFSDDTYWEDPTFTDPDKISRESIEVLLVDAEARQDKDAWIKENKKKIVRFASASPTNMAIAIGSPILCIGILCFCFKAMCGGSEEDAEKLQKKD